MISQLMYLLALGGVALVVVFTITWMVQLKTNNAGIVDPIWSLSFPLLAIIYFFLTGGDPVRKLMILSMVLVWGLRLGIHLLVRFTREHKEDVRYTALRNEWGNKQRWLMLRFYYFQATLALLLSLPFALMMMNAAPAIHWLEIAGVAIAAIAVTGESTADQQLKSFKARAGNKGKVCDEGLWYYSRHPNYFFEWLIWVSFFVAASASPWGIVTIVCPALMLYFLLKITGIPYTETQSVKSKGQAYIDYQQTTSAFVPLPKRKYSKTQSHVV